MKILMVEKIHQKGMDYLSEHAELVIAPDTTEPTLTSLVKDVDALIIRSSKLYNSVIDAGKNLKVIGRHGIGTDNIDLNYATQKKIPVVNTPTANVSSVAEFVVALMLTLSKKILVSNKALHEGKFCVSGKSLPGLCQAGGYGGFDISGKTLGVIGFGKIGQKTAEICRKGFNMKVIVFDPYLKGVELPENTLLVETIGELMSQSDYVTINVPLTPSTRHILGKEEFAKAKPGLFFINCSRGGTVDEEALDEAYRKGLIAGCAVDVFESEPPQKDNVLIENHDIILTPHAAAMSEESLQRMAMQVAESVVSLLEGKTVENVVNRI